MDFSLVLLFATLVCVLLFALLPTPAEEEDDEVDVVVTRESHWESVCDGLTDPSPEVRSRSRDQILSMGPNVLGRLGMMLSQELFLDQRPERLEAFKEVFLDFGLRGVPVLMELLEEEGNDPIVATTIIALLEKIGHRSIPLIFERLSPTTIRFLQPLFLRWGDVALRAVMARFTTEPHNKIWSSLLISFDQDAVPFLQRAMREAELPLQRVLFSIVAEIAPLDAKSLFLRSLQSQEPTLRLQGIKAMQALKTPDAFEAILPLLQDLVQDIRFEVAYALASLDAERAQNPLQEMLLQRQAEAEQDPTGSALHETLLLHALLVDISQEPAEETLLEKGLQHHHVKVRLLAHSLISSLSLERQLVYYERLIGDVDWSIIRASVRSLGTLESERAAQILAQAMLQSTPQDPIHERCEKALISLGVYATSVLLEMLEDVESPHWVPAPRVLLLGSDSRAVRALLSAFQEQGEELMSWGVEFEDLLLFLRRVGRTPELLDTLRDFLAKEPNSPMAQEFKKFLAQSSATRKQRTLTLDLDVEPPQI